MLVIIIMYGVIQYEFRKSMYNFQQVCGSHFPAGYDLSQSQIVPIALETLFKQYS